MKKVYKVLVFLIFLFGVLSLFPYAYGADAVGEVMLGITAVLVVTGTGLLIVNM